MWLQKTTTRAYLAQLCPQYQSKLRNAGKYGSSRDGLFTSRTKESTQSIAAGVAQLGLSWAITAAALMRYE